MNNIESFSEIFHKLLTILKIGIGSDNRMFQGLFYISIGMMSYKNYDFLKRKKLKSYFIILLIIFIFNMFFDFEILKVLLYVFLFLTIIQIKLKDNAFYFYLRRTSVIIYFTHMIFFFIFSIIVGFDNCGGLLGFSISLCASLVLALVVNFFKCVYFLLTNSQIIKHYLMQKYLNCCIMFVLRSLE